MPRLLKKILEEPCLGEYLIPHFTPSDVGTTNLLEMYAVISDKICQKCDVNFSLLSKVRKILYLVAHVEDKC